MRDLRTYNPAFLAEDDLRRTFSVRKHEYSSIIETLRESTGPANQHMLVIGPRGSGKTTLLLRVASEIGQDASLSARLHAVVFAEESYQVSTCGEFWLECLSRLSEQPQLPSGIDLKQSWRDLRATSDDKMLEMRCLSTLIEFADRLNKRLVLMVENLNMMFADMVEPDVGWRLRHTLQTEPRIILLASATSRFDEIVNRDKALYDFFHVYWLQPLSNAECAALWQSATQKEPTGDIRSLEILTGGSPRMLAIIAQFGASLSFGELMDDLLTLVDEHTEYFKRHLEALPTQERRVYLALAEEWRPATTREVAERARTDTNRCSAWLKRLVERGAVATAGGTPRRKLYYLTERMYNIYYLLRRHGGTSKVVESLVQFMVAFYSDDDLQKIQRRLVSEAPPFPDPHSSMYGDLLAQLTTFSQERGNPVDLGQDYELVVRLLDAGQPVPPDAAAAALFNKAVALGQARRPTEELAVYEDINERFGDEPTSSIVAEAVARSLVNRGIVLAQLGRADEAVAAFADVDRRFSTDPAPVAQGAVGRALVLKGGVFEELGLDQDAMRVYRDVLDRFARERDRTALEIRADALLGVAEIEVRAGRPDAAIVSSTGALELCPDVPHVVVLAHEVVVLSRLAEGDAQAAKGAAEVMLSNLPSVPRLHKTALETIMKLWRVIGSDQTIALTQASPAHDLLLPLTVALQRDIGLEPRVSREVDEVATDIQGRLRDPQPSDALK